MINGSSALYMAIREGEGFSKSPKQNLVRKMRNCRRFYRRIGESDNLAFPFASRKSQPDTSAKIKLFSVGRRQLVCTIAGAILYPSLVLLIRTLHLPLVTNNLLIEANIAILLFFASLAGPWGGLAAAGIGNLALRIFAGTLFSTTYSFYTFLLFCSFSTVKL